MNINLSRKDAGLGGEAPQISQNFSLQQGDAPTQLLLGSAEFEYVHTTASGDIIVRFRPQVVRNWKVITWHLSDTDTLYLLMGDDGYRRMVTIKDWHKFGWYHKGDRVIWDGVLLQHDVCRVLNGEMEYSCTHVHIGQEFHI